MATARKLAEDQVQSFNVEFVDKERWDLVSACIDRDFPDGQLSVLDVGGGNGLFADKILSCYPAARVTVIDNSDFLLAQNVEDDRKTLVNGSAEALSEAFGEQRFDVVSLNWLLHHLVRDSYRATKRNMATCVHAASGLLTPRGRVSIFENLYDGLVIDQAPSQLIYHLTASRPLARFTRRLGANTAGVGVCFLSKRQWERVLRDVGLEVRGFGEDTSGKLPLYKRTLLHLGDIRVGHFWCAPSGR